MTFFTPKTCQMLVWTLLTFIGLVGLVYCLVSPEPLTFTILVLTSITAGAVGWYYTIT